jgi:hypothetical protein
MQIETQNQNAINDFFEAFGTQTTKQYSETIVDLIVLMSEQDLEKNYKQDAVTKLKDLNRLVLQLNQQN